MSSVEEVKARIDIVDLVSETVQLRRVGKITPDFARSTATRVRLHL